LVIVNVGRPDDIETIESDPIVSAKWFYRNRVLNPDTGTPYPLVTVWLNPDGKAFSVERPRP
jgi:hypothetical protein